jgi:hypothetical protein
MSDLADRIEERAAEPLKAAQDGRSAEGHSLPDLIAADNHLAGNDALSGTNDQGTQRSAWGCLRPAQAITRRDT